MFWSVVEKYGVSVMFTALTAVRMFMRFGKAYTEKYDKRSLRLLACAGEPLNPEAFEWYYRVIGKNRCPVVDTWWQTETGMQMITTMVGEPMRPGFAGKAIPGVVPMWSTNKGHR